MIADKKKICHAVGLFFAILHLYIDKIIMICYHIFEPSMNTIIFIDFRN